MALLKYLPIFILLSNFAQAKNLKQEVIKTYCDIAYNTYNDSLITAKELKKATDKLIKSPSEQNLELARKAWIKARVPYQQSEVFRFGNKIVDDWEGKVNAWPLDEGLIDYVDMKSYGESEENQFFTANIIATPKLKVGNKTIRSEKITTATLESIHELDSMETNVATGYHAIEFLLWGQDLNGVGKGAGTRPATDYDLKKCTRGNCDRRAQYLSAAVELLISDLEYMSAQWAQGGKARTGLMAEGKENQALNAMITGMGSLSYGELAGERIKLGLMLHDPEEEHDCFSDNTHNSHYYNALGIQNVYKGTYKGLKTTIAGPGLSQLVKGADKKLDDEITQKLSKTMDKMATLVKSAENGEAFDQLIASGNKNGEKIIIEIVEALSSQTKSLEKVSPLLKLNNIEFEGSDSLDAPEKVN